MDSNLKKPLDIAIVALTVIACVVAAWFLFRKPVMQPPGLVASWSGAVNGAGGNGVVLKNVSLIEGVTGKAFQFNPEKFPYGTYTGVQIPDSPAYALTGSLSIAGWVRPRGDGYVIFFRGDHRPGLDPYGISMQANHHLHFQICGGSNEDSAFVETEIPYGEWTHVVASLDAGKGHLSLFINGALAAQTNTTVRPFGPLLADQSPGIGIGNLNDGGNTFPFAGDIDGIALYDRALSPAEIQAAYAANAANARGQVEPFPTRHQ